MYIVENAHNDEAERSLGGTQPGMGRMGDDTHDKNQHRSFPELHGDHIKAPLRHDGLDELEEVHGRRKPI